MTKEEQEFWDKCAITTMRAVIEHAYAYTTDTKTWKMAIEVVGVISFSVSDNMLAERRKRISNQNYKSPPPPPQKDPIPNKRGR